MKNYTHRTDCRLCKADTLELVLPIKASPIGDAFIPKDRLEEIQELYPLNTYLCLECGHLQNLDVVDPNLLFGNYTYRTSSSLGLVQHFQKYALEVTNDLKIPINALVVEIGSNDGSLLSAYKKLGLRVQGVDPAKIIAHEATINGINTLPEFFTQSVAQEIINLHGLANLVCANNVFAHTDNITDIVSGIHDLLSNDGVFVFEVSYLPDMIDHFVFDTIYHEHVSHHALTPLERFFNTLDMSIFNVDRVSTKGGSIRGFAQKKSSGTRPNTPLYRDMIESENIRQITKPEIYHDFYNNITLRKNILLNYIDQARAAGKTFAAYGASTTTTTLIYHFELQTRIDFIVDDSTLKQNLFSPGAHIPVFSPVELNNKKPSFVIILAWQFSKNIINNNSEYINNGGQFLIPLPNLKIVNQNT